MSFKPHWQAIAILPCFLPFAVLAQTTPTIPQLDQVVVTPSRAAELQNTVLGDVTDRDRAIPARRQLRLAAAIKDARVIRVDGGHASLFLRAEEWIPAFLEAVEDVTRRIPASTVAV